VTKSITVNTLVTTNTAPTLTGTVVDLNRTDGESIRVIVNYEIYDLFGGNLGLDETKTPNEWKLHFSDPLPTGVYDVEAYIVDKNGRLSVSDDTRDELTIAEIPAEQAVPLTIKQKLDKLAKLQRAMNLLSAAGVHPTSNDDSSTNKLFKGDKESNNKPTKHDEKKKKVDGVKNARCAKNSVTSNPEFGCAKEDDGIGDDNSLPPSLADVRSQIYDAGADTGAAGSTTAF